jgi:hypothetical protein
MVFMRESIVGEEVLDALGAVLALGGRRRSGDGMEDSGMATVGFRRRSDARIMDGVGGTGSRGEGTKVRSFVSYHTLPSSVAV